MFVLFVLLIFLTLRCSCCSLSSCPSHYSPSKARVSVFPLGFSKPNFMPCSRPSSQAIPFWALVDDHRTSPDTPPCWNKHCKHQPSISFHYYLFCIAWVLVFCLLLRVASFGPSYCLLGSIISDRVSHLSIGDLWVDGVIII